MKWFVIKIVLILIVGLGLTEIHIILCKLFPEILKLEYTFWLDKNYTDKVTLIWFIYEVMNIIKNILWVFAFAEVADMISHRLRFVLNVFFLYYVTQLCFYLWNRNTSAFANFVVYIYMGIVIIFLFIPNKKGGKLINIEDY